MHLENKLEGMEAYKSSFLQVHTQIHPRFFHSSRWMWFQSIHKVHTKFRFRISWSDPKTRNLFAHRMSASEDDSQ